MEVETAFMVVILWILSKKMKQKQSYFTNLFESRCISSSHGVICIEMKNKQHFFFLTVNSMHVEESLMQMQNDESNEK